MSFTVGTLYSPVQRILNNRVLSTSNMAEDIRKTVLELTENYKFEQLQSTGPVVQLQPLKPNPFSYSPNYFLGPDDVGLPLLKFNSFYLFIDPTTPPNPLNISPNTGYNLKFRTINDLENLMTIPGLPVYWSRHEGLIYVASTPDAPYYLFARYQHQHPFPNAGTGAAGNDPIQMPDSWQDICEYATAHRTALRLSLSSKAQELHATLYGDSKFQSSSGLEGSPGLIFQRTSQEYRDQTTTVKSFRPRMRSV